MRRIAVCIGAVCAVAALLAAPVAGAASWVNVPTSVPAGVSQVQRVPLDAVSCPAVGTCIAVGSFLDDLGESSAAELRNGSAWSPMTVPIPSVGGGGTLTGVSCVSTSMCMAVGYVTDGVNDYDVTEVKSFVEAWNGMAWTPEAIPPPPGGPGQLSGVSCATATACMAVGEYLDDNNDGFPYAEAWNGTSWSLESTPLPQGSDGTLAGVWCTSASSCMAVGNYIESDGEGDEWVLADQWNGSVWSEDPIALPPGAGAMASMSGDPAQDLGENSLNAVTCTSVSACVAVGGTDVSGVTITAGWNGTSWTVLTAGAGGNGAVMTSVSCTAPTACIAFGSSGTAAAFNGTTWSVLPTADASVGAVAWLSGVSCVAATSCVAVEPPIAEAWNGTVWTLSSLQIVDNAGSAFDAVSCTSVTACTAVGSYGSGVLVERFNGSGWAIQHAPSPAQAAVNAVSCASASACMLVGSEGAITKNEPDGTVLAERWNGTTWSITPTPLAPGLAFQAVSCTSATACIAVGGNQQLLSIQVGGKPLLLAARWNGRSWSRLSVPLPPGDQEDAGAALTGVSCSSATRCTAVGISEHNYDEGDGSLGTTTYTIAEQWNGRRWSPQRPSGTGLSAVSCPSAMSCNAIAQEWNGTSWSVGPSPHALLNSVSCTAHNACTAVGSGRIERWNGTGWAPQPAAPNLPAATFNAVSCPSVHACFMVGATVNADSVSIPLVEHYS